MRVGRSLDDLGHSMSWLDLWSFIKFSRVVLGVNSATGHVMENPPVGLLADGSRSRSRINSPGRISHGCTDRGIPTDP